MRMTMTVEAIKESDHSQAMPSQAERARPTLAGYKLFNTL